MLKTTLKIDGMACSMCEAHINDCIRKDFDVKKVKSSYKKGETVILSEKSFDEQNLKTAIQNTGYSLISVSSEPYVIKGFFK